MRNCICAVFVLLTSPIAVTQERVGGELKPQFQNIVKISKELSPPLAVMGFYGSIRSFTDTMRACRISGRGWQIDKEERLEWNRSVEIAVSQRQALVAEASGMEALNDAFWSKVFDSELDSQIALEATLKNALPPNEVDAFIIEHAKELGGCIITSTVFRDQAKIDEKTYCWLLKDRRKGFEILVNMMERNPQPGDLSQIGSPKDLELEQLRKLLVLQGRMESSMSLEEHFELVSSREREVFVTTMPKLRDYLMSKQKK